VVEPRWLILCGLTLTAGTLHTMIGFTGNTSQHTIVVTSVIQGFGIGLVFVPLNTVAFASLPPHLRTDGTSILTLVRNVASSIGISVVIANLSRWTTLNHAQLSEHITPFNDALRAPDVASALDLSTETGRAIADNLLTQQAAFIAYGNDFTLLMWLTIAAIPLVAGIQSVRHRLGRPDTPAHALD
jgi:DHA2 family multidrug resistance protein